MSRARAPCGNAVFTFVLLSLSAVTVIMRPREGDLGLRKCCVLMFDNTHYCTPSPPGKRLVIGPLHCTELQGRPYTTFGVVVVGLLATTTLT